jgi:MoaA/NifB/PqqE/SkfB family radical SAM enzyme
MCNIWKIKDPVTYPWVYQKKMVDALADIGCVYYSISGGEPTLVEDLLYRLDYICKKIDYVHLVTNGINIDKNFCKEINKSGLSEISISLDGSKEYHDFLRRKDGAFEKAYNAIELILTYAPKVTIVINSLLSFYNLEGLKKLKTYLIKLPKVYIKYLPFSEHKLFNNAGNNIFLNRDIDISEMDSFLDEIINNPRIVNSRAFFI